MGGKVQVGRIPAQVLKNGSGMNRSGSFEKGTMSSANKTMGNKFSSPTRVTSAKMMSSPGR